MQLTLNRDFTIPFFEAYIDQAERPFLNFNSLMKALEIPVDFDPATGAVGGFLADGETRLIISLERKTVEVGKITHHLAEGSFVVMDGKLLILWSEFIRWLPISAEWSIVSYEIRIRTHYKLPSAEKKERDRARQSLLTRQQNASEATPLEREMPLFGPGMFEFKTGASTGNNLGNQLNFGLAGVHRFLKGDLEYSLTRNQSSQAETKSNLDYLRLRYYDQWRENELTLGDTYITFSPLLMNVAKFRGASFYTGGQMLRFGKTAIVGTAPPGSEVDLYRSGMLIAFTRTDESGFYRFDNVPLSQQSALFELRIFTSTGRRYSEFKRVSSVEEMLSEGGLVSQGGVGQSSEEKNRYSVTGAELRYGLFNNMTVGAYALKLEDYQRISAPATEDLDTTGMLLLLRPMEWIILLLEHAQDSAQPGTAQRGGLFFSFPRASLEFEQIVYEEEFTPPARKYATEFSEPSWQLAKEQATLRTRLFKINTTLTTRRYDFGESRELNELEGVLSRRLTADLTTTLLYNQDRFAEGGEEINGGDTTELRGSYRIDYFSRAELSNSTTKSIQGQTATQQRLLYSKIQQFDSPWGYQASYTVFSYREDLTNGSVGYLFSNNIRVLTAVDNEGSWQLMVEYAVPFRVTGDGVDVLPPGSFPKAGITGRIFLDDNADGLQQDNEIPLSDVRIFAPGVKEAVSDEEGYYFGWGIPSTDPVTIEVDLLSTDALFVPLHQKYRLLPHPGELIEVNISLVPSGGLSGYLKTGVARSVSPANGVEMIMEKEGGIRIAAVRVEWDGTFIIEGIPPGDYVLYGDPEDLAARGIQLSPERMNLNFAALGDPVWLENLTFGIEKKGGGSLRSPAGK